MEDVMVALWQKAEAYRRRMQNEHERRLREAAAELSRWLDFKAAEVSALAVAVQAETVPPADAVA